MLYNYRKKHIPTGKDFKNAMYSIQTGPDAISAPVTTKFRLSTFSSEQIVPHLKAVSKTKNPLQRRQKHVEEANVR